MSSHERRIEDDRKRVAAKKALATAPVITALGSEETLKTRVLAIDDEHKWSEQAKAFRTANRLTRMLFE